MIRLRLIQYLIVFTTVMISSHIISSNPVYACDCSIPDNAMEGLKQADAVFTGKVINMKDTHLDGDRHDAVLIEVDEIWKGIQESQVIVYTSWSSCQFVFTEGEEYLLYAYEHHDQLNVINCGRSANVELATADLKMLGNGQSPSIQVDLSDEFDSQTWLIVLGFILIMIVLVVLIYKKFVRK